MKRLTTTAIKAGCSIKSFYWLVTSKKLYFNNQQANCLNSNRKHSLFMVKAISYERLYHVSVKLDLTNT
ncbi:hypothetical protein CWB85_18395 [Pseudoalteromonas sp. S1727]|nr:hypothetical protein CWB85_18395 [Pseudoalteromonas sp. S1727]